MHHGRPAHTIVDVKRKNTWITIKGVENPLDNIWHRVRLGVLQMTAALKWSGMLASKLKDETHHRVACDGPGFSLSTGIHYDDSPSPSGWVPASKKAVFRHPDHYPDWTWMDSQKVSDKVKLRDAIIIAGVHRIDWDFQGRWRLVAIYPY